MDENNIAQFGKGCFIKEDVRDYSFGATTHFDWTQPIIFNIPNFPISNQNGSLSCVAQSAMTMAKIFYFQRQMVLQDFSARFIYSQIFIPVSGGAYLRDGVATLLKRGIQLNVTCPSEPQTESHMRDTTDLNFNEASKYDIYPDDYAYASVPCNIDAVATAIRDNTCVMLGVKGSNATWTQAIVKPGNDWQHAIVGVGVEVIGGKKYIRFINSWSDKWADRGTGLLSEDYFDSGNVVAAYIVTTNFIKTNMLTQEEVNLFYDIEGLSKDDSGRSYWVGKPTLEMLKTRKEDLKKIINS